MENIWQNIMHDLGRRLDTYENLKHLIDETLI